MDRSQGAALPMPEIEPRVAEIDRRGVRAVLLQFSDVDVVQSPRAAGLFACWHVRVAR